MNIKNRTFLGAPLTPFEAVVGHLTFRKNEKPPYPPVPAHVGKFGQAICFTIEELKGVFADAETYLIQHRPVGQGEEHSFAFYFIINTTDRVSASAKGKPSIMLVGSKMRTMADGTIKIFNIIEEIIDKLPDDRKNNPASITKGDIDSIIKNFKIASYSFDLYDMGDRHP